MIIDGLAIADNIKSDLKKKIGRVKNKPGLGIILVGRDRPSQIFVKNKIRFCHQVGINTEIISISASLKTASLKKTLSESIKKLNRSNSIHGIIVQLPLPGKLNTLQNDLFSLIDPQKDVDSLNPANLGLITSGKAHFMPAVAGACTEILKRYRVSLKGKNVLVVGWGQAVGKPLLPILLSQGATVTVCNEFTKNLKEFSRYSDVIISAVGKPGIITGNMVKKGAVVIDIGTSFRNKKIYGDFDFSSVSKKASLITPVPGGVGPVTVAMVAKTVWKFYSSTVKP